MRVRLADSSAEEVARRLFVPQPTPGTLAPVFSSALPHRALGYPFPQHDLSRRQWEAFVRVLRSSGTNDAEAFATHFSSATDYWKFSLSEEWYPYEGLIARGWPSVAQSAIYSTLGHWAITVADEEFALVAGSKELIHNIRTTMPEFSDEAVGAFVAHWRRDVAGQPPSAPPRRWVPEVLDHAFGKEAVRWVRLFRGEGI